MPLQLDDLAALDAPIAEISGRPIMVPVEAIDEDSEQPRHEFDANALQALAATIRERGVRQPVSVRPNLQQAGRWLLNFGARRLRASKIAGLMEIPAFIDTTADSYDQVIENEQREPLKPLELALFVQKRLALGDKQAEIARRLGRSRQWVTLATALIEAPDWLLDAYRQQRCNGMTELYELRRLHGEHPMVVEAWASEGSVITRERLALLRDELACRPTETDRVEVSREAQAVTGLATSEHVEDDKPGQARPRAKGRRQGNRNVHVEMDGQDYQLVVSVAPPQAGHLYVRPLTGGPRRVAPASALKLLGFVAR
jgi:ParB family transcriptional regulator, chromosome partitioning protein